MVINHNLSALYASRQSGKSTQTIQKHIEKLSSGQKINKAADDAAGLGISEKLKAQVRGLNQASQNTADGISLIQTAEGYLDQTHQLLQRIRELSVKSSNGINTSEDRMHMQVESSALIDEITRLADTAEFNTIKLLNGTFGDGQKAVNSTAPTASGVQEGDATTPPDTVSSSDGNTVKGVAFHVGANIDQRVFLSINDMRSESLGLNEYNIGTSEDANKSILTVDNAIKAVSSERAKLGAYQNRFESVIQTVDLSAENLTAAESRIRDTDMAREAVTYSKDQILKQASDAMLAQARNQPQAVLQLLQ